MIQAKVDGQYVPWRKWGRSIPRGSPARRAAAQRLVEARRIRHRRIRASGILLGAANMGFNAQLVLYVTANTTSTETIPSGCTRMTLEGWGAGGNGGGGNAGTRGGGGGGGGYSLSTFTNVTPNGGQTLVVRVTNTAVAEQTSPATQITAGSFSASFSTITIGCGTGGTNGVNGGGGGAGGPVTNANASTTNVTGNNGTASPDGVILGTGGAGIAGNISGDGGPYGTGANALANGKLGAVAFYYT